MKNKIISCDTFRACNPQDRVLDANNYVANGCMTKYPMRKYPICQRLHDNLPNSILPNALLPYVILLNLPFYPMPTYPMLFDLFGQLSNYKLAIANTRMI